ncbi:Zinc finger CCCH domain-containing protein 11A [Astathelohania contejeani]|uniref:Zinc finger CCCH domain-containing protein 11A n=1 Tax=Astathelohania contejeani TaxID=164912 RepID=A0ABQ7I1I3_9MICR|nr:Zinc finger CCCH domain-containing protein 11A [Thelohania contejeani]
MEDCYYFLYSVCKKKDCAFRHSLQSKENPVLCKTWNLKGTCKLDCPFRHSNYHIIKNRGDMMCYWESQLTGCTKKYCEYKHEDPKKDEWKGVKVKTLEEIKKDEVEYLRNKRKIEEEMEIKKIKEIKTKENIIEYTIKEEVVKKDVIDDLLKEDITKKDVMDSSLKEDHKKDGVIKLNDNKHKDNKKDTHINTQPEEEVEIEEDLSEELAELERLLNS